MSVKLNHTAESVTTDTGDLELITPANKTLLLNQVVWEDLRMPVNVVRVPTTAPPGWDAFKTGLEILWFDPDTDNQVYFATQLPHAYKEGTNIVFHTHWTPAANGNLNEVVNWGLEYSWANTGDDFPGTTTIYANAHIPTDATLVADRHYRTDFAEISGAGKEISSILMGRFFRDADGSGGTDDYGDNAGLLEIDIHYQLNTLGSRQIATKT